MQSLQSGKEWKRTVPLRLSRVPHRTARAATHAAIEEADEAAEMNDQADAMLQWLKSHIVKPTDKSQPAAESAQSTAIAYKYRSVNGAAHDESDTAIDRLREWEKHGSHRWGLGVAVDLCDLESRVAALEKNHDAAPAARASVESVAPQPTTRGDSDRTDKAAPRPSEGTGDTPATRGEGSERRECTEPVAWEVFLPGAGTYDIHSFRWEAAAIAHALLSNEGTIAAVCPLYRQTQPTLTDAEREAIKRLAPRGDLPRGDLGMTLTFTLTPAERAVFHGLLERLG